MHSASFFINIRLCIHSGFVSDSSSDRHDLPNSSATTTF